MSTSIAVVDRPQELVGGNPEQVRLGIEECWRIAKFLSAAKMFQNKGSNMSPEECMAVVMMGQGLGIPPAVAMLNIHMIEGRPSMSAELLGYFIKSSGKYDYRSTHERDENGEYLSCTVTVYETTTGEMVGESTFTMDDAKRAGLLRPRGNWEKHPGAMLHARAVSQALRWHAPDAVPIRPYALDEIPGEPSGVSVVEGQPVASPAEVEAVVEAALAHAEEVEEVEVSSEDVHEPAVQEAQGVTEEEVQDAEEVSEAARMQADIGKLRHEDDLERERRGAAVTEPLDAPDPTVLFDIETRLREDLKSLGLQDKRFIKQQIEQAGLPFSHKSILSLMAKTDSALVADWLGKIRPPAGVTGRQTGSQTEPVISDAQLGMLHARMGECGFSDQERKTFLKRFAQVESSRQVRKADFDELLQVLTDIKNGDDGTRRAYVGGEE